VAKQPELSKPGEQTGENPVLKHINELQQQGTLTRGDVVPLQLNPAEQQARERLGKPPPQKEEKVVETLDPEVEEAIRAYAMGDSEEEAQLREQAKKDPLLRDSLVHPGGRLAIPSPKFPEDLEDTSHS
jgi:hypothetical protein